MGASFSNSGMRHPSQARPWHVPNDYLRQMGIEGANPQSRLAMSSVLELAEMSKPLIANNMKRFSMTTSAEFKGCYKLYSSAQKLKAAQQDYKAAGIASERVSQQDSPFGKASLFFPQDGFGDAYVYCQALEAELRTGKGLSGSVDFIYNAENVSLVKQGGSVRGVAFGGKIVHADHIVIAAGYESPELLRPLGLKLPVYPLTGYALNFARTDRLSARLDALNITDVPIMDAQSHSALSFYDDHIRLSGTVNAASAQALLKAWAKISPELIEALGPPIRRWTGQRPMTATGHPYIGRTPIPRLWVNAGHGHMGWTLSAGSGEVLAGMLMEDKLDARFSVVAGAKG